MNAKTSTELASAKAPRTQKVTFTEMALVGVRNFVEANQPIPVESAKIILDWLTMAEQNTVCDRQAMRSAVGELEALRDGEECDHAVGVCWCGYFRTLAQLRSRLPEVA